MDLLGGIATLGSGLLNFFGGQNATDKNIAAQQQINDANWNHSLYMAQNSIQMKKADAEAAGISPLYAMGAPTMSFAPAQVGAMGNQPNALAPLATTMRDLGQDLSRPAAATNSPVNKLAGVQAAQQTVGNTLDLENKKLNNEILKARLATLTQPGTPPGQPFVVPENNKTEQRPPLMLGGYRWDTNPNTSPMKAYEDQYGDEGPVASLLPLWHFGNDLAYNAFGKPGQQPSNRDAARPDLSALPGRIQQWYNQAKAQKWVY